MGDPRKQRKKYETPTHPWNKERIDDERKLKQTYGLKRKKEIWKMASKLRLWKQQAKKLTSRADEQAEKEKKLLLAKLYKLKLLEQDAEVVQVLEIGLDDVLSRRLQTVLFKQNLAHSVDQARQFIVHGHVTVNNIKVNVPSYMVKRDEEDKIVFVAGSALADPEHPERAEPKKEKDEKKGKVIKLLKKKIPKVDKKAQEVPPEEKKVEEKKEEPKVETAKEEPKPVEVAA